MTKTKKYFRFITLGIAILYIPTIFFGLLALQGVGKFDFEAISFIVPTLIFHPISLILIIISLLGKYSKKVTLIIFFIIFASLTLQICQSLLIVGNIIKGQWFMPLTFLIPELLYIFYALSVKLKTL